MGREMMRGESSEMARDEEVALSSSYALALEICWVQVGECGYQEVVDLLLEELEGGAYSYDLLVSPLATKVVAVKKLYKSIYIYAS